LNIALSEFALCKDPMYVEVPQGDIFYGTENEIWAGCRY
jgi:hypothetical protein